MDVTSGAIERAMDQMDQGEILRSDGSGRRRRSDYYVLLILMSKNDSILK